MTGYPRGLRNNNPGNLKSYENWQGKIGMDGGFVIFSDISWGIRALGMDLRGDINEGANTIRKLIWEFAPSTENDTTAYINAVVDYTGLDADHVLSADGNTLRRLIRAIMNVELGSSYAALISDDDINEGLSKMPGGSNLIGPVGFGFSVVLFGFALWLLATMPKVKG